MGSDAAPNTRFREAFAGRRVCVTGGAGFIGGHLVQALLGLGADVTVIDDLSNSDGTRLDELQQASKGKLHFVLGSILDPAALADATAGVEYIFHEAAIVSVPRSVDDPERTMEVNEIGTLRVADAARAAGVKRWVFAASSAAYGDESALPQKESETPKPLSPYAASKLAGEYTVRAWAETYGTPGVSLRYFNVFGPHQSAEGPYSGVIAAFCTRILAGTPPTIYGDGSYSRDFTPVANVVRANLLAALAPESAMGEVMNVGLGKRTTILELASSLASIAGRPDLKPTFQPARAGDVPHSQADLTKAREILGYTPDVDLQAGLAETVEWYRRAPRATDDG
ncbi:MAG TPA: NAD-dependent epimerase/dehydratase family protein [Phycisphaerales bacterium]|nr:NAD-dependent epimerase/dehydratase family protein [Phycisphaerales bacterium]